MGFGLFVLIVYSQILPINGMVAGKLKKEKKKNAFEDKTTEKV